MKFMEYLKETSKLSDKEKKVLKTIKLHNKDGEGYVPNVSSITSKEGRKAISKLENIGKIKWDKKKRGYWIV